MKAALETRPTGGRPTLEEIVATLGGFSSATDGLDDSGPKRERASRRHR